jgi:hypothetical protein
VRVYFGVDFKSRKGGFDPSKKIDKENIPTLEAQLKAAEETLSDVSTEIEFARTQELLLREASGMEEDIPYALNYAVHFLLLPRLHSSSLHNSSLLSGYVIVFPHFLLVCKSCLSPIETTASRIQWFGILSIAVLLITSLWQIVYLRHFFASKKLL